MLYKVGPAQYSTVRLDKINIGETFVINNGIEEVYVMHQTGFVELFTGRSHVVTYGETACILVEPTSFTDGTIVFTRIQGV